MSATVIIFVIVGLTALLIFLVIANNKDKKDLEQTLNETDMRNDVSKHRNADEQDAI